LNMLKIGDGGLGIGDWGLGIGPNPQSPIPNPQSPIPIFLRIKGVILLNKINKIKLNKLYNMANNEASKLLPKPINIRDYELSKTIGIGTYSIVKLSKAQQTNKFYAVKKIRKADMIKLGLVEHVRNEIKALSAAESIFIEKYQGFAMDEKYIYIATELLVGGDFSAYLRKEVKLPVTQAQ